MGAIRVIQKPENGKLIIAVPDELGDELMVIEFRPAREGEEDSFVAVSDAFFNNLKRVKTDFTDDDFSTYDQ